MYYFSFLTLLMISTQIFASSGEQCLDAYREMLKEHKYYIPGSETVDALSDIKDCFKEDRSSYIDLGIILAPWMVAAAPVRAAVGAAKSALLPVDFAKTQIRQTKYTDMHRFMIALNNIIQQAKGLSLNNTITKDNFSLIINTLSLQSDRNYLLFANSELFQNFRKDRPETDHDLINALLYNYLFGTLMCGETREFSPISLKKFTRAFFSTELLHYLSTMTMTN